MARSPIQRDGAAVHGIDPVTVEPQRLGEQVPDVGLVVHDQDRPALRRLEPRLGSMRVGGLGPVASGGGGGQLDDERRAAFRTVDGPQRDRKSVV